MCHPGEAQAEQQGRLAGSMIPEPLRPHYAISQQDALQLCCLQQEEPGVFVLGNQTFLASCITQEL